MPPTLDLPYKKPNSCCKPHEWSSQCCFHHTGACHSSVNRCCFRCRIRRWLSYIRWRSVQNIASNIINTRKIDMHTRRFIPNPPCGSRSRKSRRTSGGFCCGRVSRRSSAWSFRWAEGVCRRLQRYEKNNTQNKKCWSCFDYDCIFDLHQLVGLSEQLKHWVQMLA